MGVFLLVLIMGHLFEGKQFNLVKALPYLKAYIFLCFEDTITDLIVVKSLLWDKSLVQNFLVVIVTAIGSY